MGIQINGQTDSISAADGSLIIGGTVDNLNVSGIVTANTLKVGSGVTISAGIISATEFRGSGASLTGIDATALKDSGGNVIVQANESGIVVSGILTASSSGIGIGTTTTSGRNAGVGTAAGTVIYNMTENAIQAYSGSEWNLAPGKVSAFRAYLNSGQSIVEADTISLAQTKIAFDNNSLLDNLGEFNTTDNAFVVTHTGIYYLTASIQWGGNNSMYNGGEVWSRMIQNATYTGNVRDTGTGTQIASTFSRTFGPGTYQERGVFHTLSWVGPLTAGDSITVTLYQRSGVTFNISSGANGTTSFSGFRVA